MQTILLSARQIRQLSHMAFVMPLSGDRILAAISAGVSSGYHLKYAVNIPIDDTPECPNPPYANEHCSMAATHILHDISGSGNVVIKCKPQ